MYHLLRQRRRLLLTMMLSGGWVLSAALAASCGDSSDAEPVGTPTADTRPPLQRLTSTYSDPKLDPSAAAWEALIADGAVNTGPISVVEFVQLREGDGARSSYETFLATLTDAVPDAGGTLLSINDILFPGIEGLEAYEGGISWIATFPTIDAYVQTMLDPRVAGAAESRRNAIVEAQVLAGPNLLPDVILQLPPNEPASAFPSERVAGKSPDEIVAELLQIYPSGGADPTEATLRRMTELEGFADQRIHFINLYRFNDAAGGGEQALGEYNAAALPVVLAHGGRPKVLANVTHNLVGPTAWDRFIFVSWPSLSVFTDLRLDPTYIDAQKNRVMSAEQYGNLIHIARADAKESTGE